ncbi:tetratricopeptide repeat protein [Budviciaceae bacterium BWR-B9]|uniref:Tetratricopeptide repeat protein n=1 Tax=Limnobaculum allomyrinae TaxID=2791986 RepID=A0ABS1IP47_9GAMM|nr:MULTISPECIES: tetratricopeptide repeat protein [Limnobaculum]MBK5143538.1 tetratricopeptide repeat protein [Limnobaculum allomyrinae]MBV7691426.1 tetratricopeptide repeat protein [Limnobaculum sp. M2-1]
MKSNPQILNQKYQEALGLYNKGEYLKAEGILRQLIQRAPRFVDALHLLGVVYYLLGRHSEAESFIRKAILIKPSSECHFNLGLVYRELNKDAEAETAFLNAIKLDPRHAKAANNLGNIELTRKNFAKAEHYYNLAITSSPKYALAYKNLGLILRDTNQEEKARQALLKAIEFDPNLAESYSILAGMYEKDGEFQSAIDMFKKIDNYCSAQRAARRGAFWDGLDELDKTTLQSLTSSNEFNFFEPWSLLNVSGLTPVQHRDIGKKFAQFKLKGVLQRPPVPLAPSLPADSVLRIGYLSSDFYNHATMHLMSGILEKHNTDNFFIRLYSYSPQRKDAYTERLNALNMEVVDLSNMSDSAAAKTIAQDNLHILVDLKGFTQNTRLEITALRPAPVIVSWLGYPGSLGEPRLADYIIGDPVVTPVEHAEHFSETLALMPYCYQPNDDRKKIAPRPTRAEQNLPEDAFVFCSFNQIMKYTPETFALWCKLLHNVPNSVLWLLTSTSVPVDNLRAEAVKNGIDPQRLIFADSLSVEQHLGRLQLADLALDTYPVGSHTTASDALWAGVPLVTRLGPLFASRVAASLLTAVGLPELVTATDEDYYQLALSLANDPARLQQLKEKLAANRTTSPLFDTERFTRDLERLYRAIWQQHSIGNTEHHPIVLQSE